MSSLLNIQYSYFYKSNLHSYLQLIFAILTHGGTFYILWLCEHKSAAIIMLQPFITKPLGALVEGGVEFDNPFFILDLKRKSTKKLRGG